jgi:hypothetical protein
VLSGLGTEVRSRSRADHDLEDVRSIAAVERFRAIFGADWPAAVPSLAHRLHDHVALGDCPLGRRQAGAAAHLIERRV